MNEHIMWAVKTHDTVNDLCSKKSPHSLASTDMFVSCTSPSVPMDHPTIHSVASCVTWSSAAGGVFLSLLGAEGGLLLSCSTLFLMAKGSRRCAARVRIWGSNWRTVWHLSRQHCGACSRLLHTHTQTRWAVNLSVPLSTLPCFCVKRAV